MPDEEGEIGADGYLTLLPYLARESGSVSSIVAGMTPWGAPLVSGLRGEDEAGRPWLGLICETPVSYLRVAEPMGVKEHELLHLQRLAVDARLATGSELYDAIVGEAEPPDFVVTSQGQRVGVEMTQFTISQRRQAQALFFEVTSRLADQQRHRLTHLAGYQVYMWFGSASDGASLPYRKNDAASYNAVVEALVAHYPDPDAHLVKGGNLPEQVDVKPVRATGEVQYFSLPLLGGVPATPFYAMTGLHTVLAFQSDHVAVDEWARLRTAVERKDRDCNNVLVVSVGAPDRLGRCFASEESLASFMLDNPEPLSTKHLSSVILHFWSTGRAVELVGDSPKELWRGYLQGWSPASHPFRLPDATER